MIKLAATLVVALCLVAASYWHEATTLAGENAKHEQLITTLREDKDTADLALAEQVRLNDETLAALELRNIELRQKSQLLASLAEYQSQLEESNPDAKAFNNIDLPGAISCLFNDNTQASGLPPGNCEPVAAQSID